MADLADLAIKPPPHPAVHDAPPPPVTIRRPTGNDLPGILTWLEPRIMEANPRATSQAIRGWLIQCLSDNVAFFRWDPASDAVVLATVFQEPLGEPYAMGRLAVAKDGHAAQPEILRICGELAVWTRRLRLRAIVFPAIADIAASDFRKAVNADTTETRKMTAFFLADQPSPFAPRN